MGTSGNSDSQVTDLPDDALAISVGSLVFQSLLETAGTASLLVELKGVVAQTSVGLLGEDKLHEGIQKTAGDLEHGYQITTDPPVGKREQFLSRTSERASAAFPMPLRRGIG